MSEKVVAILNDKIINLLNLDPDLEEKKTTNNAQMKKNTKN